MRLSARSVARSGALLGASLVLASCGGDGGEAPAPSPATSDAAAPAPAASALPASVEIATPSDPHRSVEFVEDESETIADSLLELSEALLRRRFEGLDAWFADDFAGHALDGVPVGEETPLPAGATRAVHDAADARVVDREGFVASLRALLEPWTRVDSVLWKVKAAEFERARPRWGRLELALRFLGRGADGSVVSVHGKAVARATFSRGKYAIDRLQLASMETDTRRAPMFVDVAAATGLAHTWARFGTPDNDSFHWNGAAASDVDADGDWDLFVPSDGRNFLYVAQPDGTWSEEAEARGLAQPDAGTGAVFFDCDRDGDQDLLVGHVGWREGATRDLAGETLALYLNDGEGAFERVTAPGLEAPRVAYTLTVFDADGDGWLDVHACGYGRVEVEHNDSWIEATNGSPNALLRNLGADASGAFLGFADVSGDAGITDDRWSYAAAAADVDEDGDLDLYVANDYGSNRLWINDGGGAFTDGADAFGLADRGNGMGVSFGDLSGDGRLDVYVSNMSSTAGNRILRRLGEDIDAETHALLTKLAAGNSIFVRGEEDARFERLPAERGGIGASWAWSPALVDLDLDGDLDVFCANGFVTGKLAFDT
ncbi:MAG: VCBS repeat-containing protein [Planctomycetota bacterium]